MQQRSEMTRFGFVLNVKVVFSSSNTCVEGMPWRTRISDRTKSRSLMVLEDPGTRMTLPTLALKHARKEASFWAVITPGSQTDRFRIYKCMLSSSQRREIPDSFAMLFSRAFSST